jgi:hypothetical protein
MKIRCALPSAVRAPPPSGWKWDAVRSELVITDGYGWPDTYHVLALDDHGSAFELLTAGGERFGESFLVLLDGSYGICSCPGGDCGRPCGHVIALAALNRVRRIALSSPPKGP